MGTHLEFLFHHFKVRRLHAILHDAAAAVRAHGGEGPVCRYRIGQGPNSGLLDHVTGLLFCLYQKLFLSPIFDSVDFWCSMSCIVLDIELEDENVIKEFGVLLGEALGILCSSFKSEQDKPTKQAFWCTTKFHGIAWNSGSLENNELQHVLPKILKAEYFAKGSKKASVWAI